MSKRWAYLAALPKRVSIPYGSAHFVAWGLARLNALLTLQMLVGLYHHLGVYEGISRPVSIA